MSLVEFINTLAEQGKASTAGAPPPINPGGPLESKPGWFAVLGKLVLQFAPKDWTPAQLGNSNKP